MNEKPFRPGGSKARRAEYAALVAEHGEPLVRPREGWTWLRGTPFASHDFESQCLWCGAVSFVGLHSPGCPFKSEVRP